MSRGNHNFKKMCDVILPLSESKRPLEALKEWEMVDGFYHEYETHCICGVKILFNFMIKNKLNGNYIPSAPSNDLPIGSTCIKRFLPADEGRKCQELENKMNAKKEKKRVQLEEPQKLCCFCGKYHKRRTDVKLGRICCKCEKAIKGTTLYFKILFKDMEKVRKLDFLLYYDKEKKMNYFPFTNSFSNIQKLCFNYDLLQDLPVVFLKGREVSVRKFVKRKQNPTY